MSAMPSLTITAIRSYCIMGCFLQTRCRSPISNNLISITSSHNDALWTGSRLRTLVVSDHRHVQTSAPQPHPQLRHEASIVLQHSVVQKETAGARRSKPETDRRLERVVARRPSMAVLYERSRRLVESEWRHPFVGRHVTSLDETDCIREQANSSELQ